MVVIEEISQDDDDDIVDEVELSSEALLLLKESIGTAGSDLGQFDGAWSVALLEDLRLCVAERNGCRLQLVQPSNLEEGCSTIPVIEALEDVQGILRDGPFIWVADMGTHRVTRIDASTGEITASVGDGSLRYPRCLCMQRSRRGELDDPTAAGPHLPSRLLYVGDSGNSRVVAYDVDTLTEVRAFGHAGENDGAFTPGVLQLALAVCVDEKRGEVYVVDGHTHRISVFAASSGRYIRCVGRPGKGPGEFKSPFDALIVKGMLVVTEATRVQVLTLEGSPKFVLEVPDASNLAGLCFDEDSSTLYVCDYTRGCIWSLTVCWDDSADESAASVETSSPLSSLPGGRQRL